MAAAAVDSLLTAEGELAVELAADVDADVALADTEAPPMEGCCDTAAAAASRPISLI